MTPNVLIIIADDQRFDFLGYMPNVINRLAAPGRQFTHCRCNVGLCQPSRVGLLTGQYATRHGVLYNSADSLTAAVTARKFYHNYTLGRWVHDAVPPPGQLAYRTALIGKYLNGATGANNQGIHPEGWDTWRQLVDNGTAGVPDDFGYTINADGTAVAPAKYQMDYLVSQSLTFIEGGTQPWFLLLAASSPHLPFTCRPEDVFAYSDVHWPLVIETDTTDKPSWISAWSPLKESDIEQCQATARAQLREIKGLDRAVGEILDHLEANGQLTNTLVIYVSDNGYEYGEHNSRETKNTGYDVSLRVPLVMCGPEVTPGVSDEPVCMGIDVTATVLAVTGAQAVRPLPPPQDDVVEPLPQDGVDLRDVINNPQAYASRQLLHQTAEFLQVTNAVFPSGSGITTPTRKLWRWDIDPSNPSTDQYEAYDLDEDADEWENWANDSVRGRRTPMGDPASGTDLYDLVTALDTLIEAHSPPP